MKCLRGSVCLAALLMVASPSKAYAGSQLGPVSEYRGDYMKVGGNWYHRTSTGPSDYLVSPNTALARVRPGFGDRAALQRMLDAVPGRPAAQYRIADLHSFEGEDWCTIRTDDAVDIMDAVADLRTVTAFEAVHPDVGPELDFDPDDPVSGELGNWHLFRTGATDAWDITTGSTSVLLVVVDPDGLDMDHTTGSYDLAGKYHSGIDRDYVDNDHVPENKPRYRWYVHPKWYFTDYPHGTACISIAAGEADDGVGVAGVACGSSAPTTTAARVSSSSNIRSTFEYYGDLAYGGTYDKVIISCSWSYSDAVWPSVKSNIEAGIYYARSRGAMFVFSAGNYGDTETTIRYPARNSETIAVGASDSLLDARVDNAEWESSYGSKLDLVAPGEKIPAADLLSEDYGYNGPEFYSIGLTTFYSSMWHGANNTSDHDYTLWFNGTSAAAPQVAGALALMYSASPDLPDGLATEILLKSCDQAGGVDYDEQGHRWYDGVRDDAWNEEMGYGRLNVRNAVALAALYGLSAQESLDIPGTVRVPRDMELSIPNGCTLSFAEDAELIVEGTLEAYNVTFQRDDPEDWGGILVSGAGAELDLDGCEISGATYGVNITGANANVTLDDCFIAGNYRGVYCDYSSSTYRPTIEINECDISRNDDNGVYLKRASSDSYIQWSDITYNGGYGLYITMCEPQIGWTTGQQTNDWDGANDISFNGRTGVFIYSASPDILWNDIYSNYWNMDMEGCYSIIDHNNIYDFATSPDSVTTRGVVMYDSEPDMDDNWLHGATDAEMYVEWEELHTPSLTGNGIHIDDYDGEVETPIGTADWAIRFGFTMDAGTIALASNWWGTASVEADKSYLFSSTSKVNTSSVYNDQSYVRDDWAEASRPARGATVRDGIALEQSGDLEGAKSLYESLLSSGDTDVARRALSRLFVVLSKSDATQGETETYFANAARNASNESAQWRAEQFRREAMVRHGDLVRAVGEYRTVAEDVGAKATRRRTAWLSIAHVADELGDAALLDEAVSAIGAWGSETAAASRANALWGSRARLAAPMIETTLEAHPNPANPTTTVRYAIAEPGDVSLRVHNIAGQLVRTLVDARREPGMHSVTWNARDDAGRQVASGVYLIRLTTPVETLTTRVVLVQ